MKKIVSLLFAVSAIYLNTWAVGIREFSSSDSSTLLNIAIQNPLINGDAVYSARVMLNINPDDYNNSNRMSESDTEEEPVSKNTVYPNPNDGTMSLSYYIDADAERDGQGNHLSRAFPEIYIHSAFEEDVLFDG